MGNKSQQQLNSYSLNNIKTMKALLSNNKKLIAVIGATGQQGGAVVLEFGFVRPNCACKQNSRPATKHVFHVGTS